MKKVWNQIKILTLAHIAYDSEFKQYHNNKYCDIQSGFQ